MLFNCGFREDSWESLDCREFKPVNPKGNLPWMFTGRADVEAETPVLWPPDAKNWLTRKDSDAGKGWRQVENGTVGWDGWIASLTWWTWVWASSGGLVMDTKAWHSAVHGVTTSWTWLTNWTELKIGFFLSDDSCLKSLCLLAFSLFPLIS